MPVDQMRLTPHDRQLPRNVPERSHNGVADMNTIIAILGIVPAFPVALLGILIGAGFSVIAMTRETIFGFHLLDQRLVRYIT